MTFEEILDQAIAMLQRRRRVSYRALQRQFQLDDAYLQDLTVEIVEVLQLAVDQDRTMLVWTGDPSAPAPVSLPPPSLAPPDSQEPHPIPHAPAPSVQQAPEAERRQLTVLFCDLVDSTKLSSQLDPEDWRDVVREYQRVCTDVIQRYDGHIAQLLGDGLLVYLGYPRAHEDDAQRAVRAGLGMLEAVEALNSSLALPKGLTLAVRLGIHTGLVVVGAMGGGGRQEQLALGEVPNIASRIQGLAEPNTIAVSEATYRLIQGYFECEDLGAQTLRGVAEPIHVYRVLQDSGARGRLDVAVTRGLTPLVGRESEVTLLLERWEQAQSGQGQVVLLTGDAGIGKSRLVQILKEYVANQPHACWECRSLSYFENTALFPLTDLFQRLWQFHTEDTADEKLGKLEQALSQYRLPLGETVSLFAPLLSLPIPEDRYPLPHLSPQRQRQKTLETIVTLLQEHAERHPVLFVVEDLHWTDPSTLELLNLIIEQIPTTAMLTVLTCRPHFQPAWHHRSYITEITVNRLSHTQVAQIVTAMTDGKTFPAAVLQQIIAKTDGVPLFVEEMTKAILESGHLKDVNGHYELTGSLSTFAIPATLHDSLMARLDRLVTAKGVAQIGATIGRQFSYLLLKAVSHLDETTLQRELGRLVEVELLYQRGLLPQAAYTFKHALIQDAAYQSLLKSTRQQYHQRIAQILEEQFAETTEAQPELLAHHYTEAGLTGQAVTYWYKAGQSTAKRSAHAEAITHLRQGLVLLQTLPETSKRTQREVDMLITLGASLLAVQGYAAPEVGEIYMSARQLCGHLEDPYQLFPVLRGLWSYYNNRAEYQTAHALGEQLLALAQQVQDSAMLVAAHRALGTTLFWMGAVAAAQTHFAQGIALYDPKQHRASAFLYGEDTGVICRSYAAWMLWHLGYPDQGLTRSHEALRLAQQSTHSLSLSFVLSYTAQFHQYRHEVRFTHEHAEAAISLAMDQGFPQWMTVGAMLRGWALAQQGQAQEGIAQIQQGLTAWRAIGSELARPYFLTLLAEAHQIQGEAAAGLTVLTEALALAETTGDRWYELHYQTLFQRGDFN
jgi:class 3 adenylate cyclase/predicted ATPase